MTGILIVTHSNLGQALIEAAEFILDTQLEKISFISINIKEDADSLHKKIKQGLKKIQSNRGVIILTDMFGGTPSNLSYSFLKEGSVEVISGVNLPILLKAVNIREKMEISEAAVMLVEHGKRSISLASGILKGNKKK
ncbi:MAG: PTS fructose transporter subunit IIA [Thermodesulfobacteriota bacterium]|nr:PTS fructose transporter subunit IIA [Thermodesulfobacteriota bacterium]